MSTVRILNAKEIERLFRLDMAVAAVERAYRQKSEGAGQVWPMVFHEFQHGVADLDIKSGDLMAEQIFGLKVVSWFGENGEKNLPALFGTSLLFDRRTGEPKALLNAGPITGLRTGAAAAVGAKALARPESESLLMVGCGHQSPYLIAATLYVMPGIRRVQVANAKNPARAAEALPALTEKVAALLSACGAERDYTVTAAADLEAAVRESDVILTATPSYEPLIRAGWVRLGTHLSCIGADMSGKEELLLRGRVRKAPRRGHSRESDGDRGRADRQGAGAAVSGGDHGLRLHGHCPAGSGLGGGDPGKSGAGGRGPHGGAVNPFPHKQETGKANCRFPCFSLCTFQSARAPGGRKR